MILCNYMLFLWQNLCLSVYLYLLYPHLPVLISVSGKIINSNLSLAYVSVQADDLLRRTLLWPSHVLNIFIIFCIL
jgi:hypothetical protein